MVRNKILGILLSLAIVGALVGLWVVQSSQSPSRGALAKSDSPPQPPLTDQDEIIFAGISGLAPRYIESGPDRGFGWVDRQTLEIRKGMKIDGFRIKQEWMTPARIAHEFKKKHPICVYPVEWHHPESVFKQKPDRIYSIGLEFGGEASRSIIFNKEDYPKFKKFVDLKGDLILEALIRDSSLKTLLVRDRDYGPLNEILTDVDDRGDRVVRKEFQKNVMLLVTKENRQLIEMLHAKRFDYTFSDSIEAQDLTSSKLDESQFMKLNFKNSSIERVGDPELVMRSIACAEHSLTLQAMPYFNKWIQMLRGTEWERRILNYRLKIDPNLKLLEDPYNRTSLFNRFGGAITRGALDAWYPRQQKYFPGLAVYPPAGAPPKLESASSEAPRPRKAGWALFQEDSSSVMILSEAELGFLSSFPERSFTEKDKLYRFEQVYDALNEKQRNLIQRESHTLQPLEELPIPSPKGLKSLTLFAVGLSVSEVARFEPLISTSQLESLAVIGASKAVSAWVVERLPRTLKRLMLTSSSLGETEIVTRMAGLPLTELQLTDSQLTEDQLTDLLTQLPSSIEGLSLGYLRTAWSLKSARAFGKKKWPQLKFLDLETDYLKDAHLSLIIQGLAPSLERLKLGNNLFTPRETASLFAQDFPKLEELDLSYSTLVSSRSRGFSFPSQLKRLTCARCGLSGETVGKIRFPRKLSSLDLEGNLLGPRAFEKLGPHLSEKMALLNLASTRLGGEGVRALTDRTALRQIAALSLRDNGLTDLDLQTLTQSKLEVSRLDLSSNLIRNEGAQILSQKWMRRLLALNFSENLISDAGVRSLASEFGPQLEQLDLSGLLSLDAGALAERLPKQLKALNLGNNQLSDPELQVLAPKLPSSLQVLNLLGSGFGTLGAWVLATHLPPRLNSLVIASPGLAGEGMSLLARHLPLSLRILVVIGGEFGSAEINTLGEFLPKRLQQLTISFKEKAGHLTRVMEALPASLRGLYLVSTSLSARAASALSKNWPESLRRFRVYATDMTHEAALQMGEHFPNGVEGLVLVGPSFDDAFFEKLTQSDFKNIHFLTFSDLPGLQKGLKKFFKKARGVRNANLWQLAQVERALSSFSAEDFSPLSNFDVVNSRVSEKAVIELIRKLPSDLVEVNLTSLGLTLGAVDGIIGHLPKNLHELRISGNPIGEAGLKKFRTYQARRERESEMPFLLVE